MTTDDDLRRLCDERAIYRVLTGYCHGIDRRDMALVRSVYHDDGVDRHTGFDGPADDFVIWVQPLLATFDGTQHTLGNHRVDIVGDHAVSETYATATHWSSDPSPERNFTAGVRYVDHLARRDGRWAIVERFAVRDCIRRETTLRGNPATTVDDPTVILRAKVATLGD